MTRRIEKIGLKDRIYPTLRRRRKEEEDLDEGMSKATCFLANNTGL